MLSSAYESKVTFVTYLIHHAEDDNHCQSGLLGYKSAVRFGSYKEQFRDNISQIVVSTVEVNKTCNLTLKKDQDVFRSDANYFETS